VGQIEMYQIDYIPVMDVDFNEPGQTLYSGSSGVIDLNKKYDIPYQFDIILLDEDEPTYNYMISDDATATGQVHWQVPFVFIENAKLELYAEPQDVTFDQPRVFESDIFSIDVVTRHVSDTPNPFSEEISISFTVAEPSNVVLEIYDALGRLVTRKSQYAPAKDLYEFKWDGKNDSGQSVTPGLYLYRLKAGDYEETKKIIYIK
jgi:hypothetical protein